MFLNSSHTQPGNHSACCSSGKKPETPQEVQVHRWMSGGLHAMYTKPRPPWLRLAWHDDVFHPGPAYQNFSHERSAIITLDHREADVGGPCSPGQSKRRRLDLHQLRTVASVLRGVLRDEPLPTFLPQSQSFLLLRHGQRAVPAGRRGHMTAAGRSSGHHLLPALPDGVHRQLFHGAYAGLDPTKAHEGLVEVIRESSGPEKGRVVRADDHRVVLRH